MKTSLLDKYDNIPKSLSEKHSSGNLGSSLYKNKSEQKRQKTTSFDKINENNKESKNSLNNEKYGQNNDLNIPTTAYEYLEQVTQTVNITDIYEVQQIFKFKEGSSFANDYVCLVLKITPQELIDFYGGSYLFQVWKNKERLYQHIHQSKVSEFYGSKTEIVYLTEGDQQNIIIIQPFLKQVLQIQNPFYKSTGVKLFVNDEHLLASKQNKLIGISLDEIKRSMKSNVKSDPLLEYENDFEQLITNYDLSTSRNETRIRLAKDVSENTLQNQNDISSKISKLKDSLFIGEDCEFIQFIRTKLPSDLNILHIDYDFDMGLTIEVFAAKTNSLILEVYKVEILSQNTKNIPKTTEKDKDLSKDQISTQLIRTIQFNQEQIQNNLIQDEIFVQMQMGKIQSKTYLLHLKSNQGHSYFLQNYKILAQETDQNICDIFFGTEAIYFKNQNQTSFKISLNKIAQQNKFCLALQEETQDFLVSIVQEKFIRLHNLKNSGEVENSNSENYFCFQDNEIKSINLMNANELGVYEILVQYKGNYLMKLIVYSLSNQIRSTKSEISLSKYVTKQIFTNCDFMRYRQHGEVNLCIRFQAFHRDNPDLSTIYYTNKDSLLIQQVIDLPSNLRLINIQTTAVSTLFLADIQQKQLLIFNLVDIYYVLNNQELWDNLIQKIDNFDYLEVTQYFLDSDQIYYEFKGNLVEINLQTGQKFTFDFHGYIKNLMIIEGRNLYLRCDQDNLYFLDLDWIMNKEFLAQKQLKDSLPIFSEHTKLIWSPIVKCKSLLINKFEFDSIANKIATFSTPWQIKIINPMNESRVDLIGTKDFYNKFLTYSLKLKIGNTQRDIVALNHKEGKIYSWYHSTGFLKCINSLQNGQNYSKYELLSQFQEYSLIYYKNQNSFLCKKISITSDFVEEHTIFHHPLNLKDQYYISQNNQLLLEYEQDLKQISLYNIDLAQTNLIQNINLAFNFYNTQLFSPYFDAYINKDSKTQELKIYQLSYLDEEQNLPLTYEICLTSNLPQLSQIKHCNKVGLPLISLDSRDQISFITNNDVIQTIPLYQDLNISKKNLSESYIEGSQLDNFQRSVGMENDQFLRSLDSEESLELLAQITKRRLIEPKKAQFFRKEFQSFVNSNLRTVQSYTFYHWRVIDLLEKDEINIENISIEVIQELLNVILPNGDTLIHRLISSNIAQFEKLIKIIKCNREKHQIKFNFMPNQLGQTPLHLCIKNQYSKALGLILQELSFYPLDDHIKFIREIFAEILQTNPIAFGEYLDSRILKPNWALQYTEGELIFNEGCNFAVVSDQLQTLNFDKMKRKLFQRNQQEQNSESNQTKTPLIQEICDFPEMHHFSSQNGIKFLQILASARDIEQIYSRRYIQALLEVKLLIVRRAITLKLICPYVLYLVIFGYLSQNLNFDESDSGLILKILSQVILTIMTFMFLQNSVKQIDRNNQCQNVTFTMWNYTDIIPKFLVLISILLSVIDELGLLNIKAEANVLFAFTSFMLWFHVLYFFRLFRKVGFLIQMIIEVVIDMKYFLGIIVLTILSYSGSFLILSKNNSEGDQFLTNYTESKSFVYRLMLGDFDTSNFGTVYVGAVWMLFLSATIFLIVIMLNLLIAIISDTFARVQGSSQQRMYQEFASLIIENVHLLSQSDIEQFDSQGDYLYIARLEQDVEVNQDSILESKINDLKYTFQNKFDQLINLIEKQK